MNSKVAKFLRAEARRIFQETFKQTAAINPQAVIHIPPPHRIYKQLKRDIRVRERDGAT